MNKLMMIYLAIPWMLTSTMISAQDTDTTTVTRVVVLTEGVPTVVDLNADGSILAKIMELPDYFDADLGDQHYIDLSYSGQINQSRSPSDGSGAISPDTTALATRRVQQDR